VSSPRRAVLVLVVLLLVAAVQMKAATAQAARVAGPVHVGEDAREDDRLAEVGPAQTPGVYVSGYGTFATANSVAAFGVYADDANGLYFEYWDYETDPPRYLTLDSSTPVECVGDRFGGQTVRVTGHGWDSERPNDGVDVQLFLVDRGSKRDRVSVKVQRRDGKVTYFMPMTDLDEGDLSISCPS
jgi:hypothetical protein